MMGSSTDRRLNTFGSTLQRDAWRLELLPVVLVLSAFGIYAAFRAFAGKFYAWGPYLSPFYCPLIDRNHHWWRFSPALLILAGPLGLRATLLLLSKDVLSSIFLHPPACAVSEGDRGAYRGETRFPFILQNLRRWFLYLALVFLAFLWWGAIRAFFFQDGFGKLVCAHSFCS
jgi:hypothetical protein